MTRNGGARINEPLFTGYVKWEMSLIRAQLRFVVIRRDSIKFVIKRH